MSQQSLTRLRFLLDDAVQNLQLLWRQNVLALIGISAGSACFIAMLNIGGSVQQEIRQIFTEMGPGRFVLNLTWDSHIYNQPQRIHQALSLFRPPRHVSIAPVTRLNTAVFHHGDMMSVSLIATTPAAADALGLKIAHGRFIHSADAAQKSVVLGAAAAYALNPANPAALTGQYIRVDKLYFNIVGVLNPAPDSPLLPFSLNQSLLMHAGGLSRFSGQPQVQTLIGNVAPPLNPETNAQELERAVRALPGMQDVQLKLPAQLVDSMQKSQRQFSYFLFSVGAISLLLGSIGIINIMLSNIRARAPEIGLRLAVGAQVKDIRYLFLLESALLTSLGAAAGLLFGAALTGGYALLTDTPVRLSAGYSLLGLLGTVLVSMLFGLYPAIKASRLQPVEALRNE